MLIRRVISASENAILPTASDSGSTKPRVSKPDPKLEGEGAPQTENTHAERYRSLSKDLSVQIGVGLLKGNRY